LQTRREFYARMARRVEGYVKAFEEFTKELCASNLAEEAYLVGSRARGDWASSSDFDVVVVVGDYVDPIDIAARVRLLKGKGVPMDVVVLRRGELGDPVYAEMLRYARRIC